MSLKPRYTDLLVEFRERHLALWDSLSLLAAEEWDGPPLADNTSARQLLLSLVANDAELSAYCQAAAVGLDEPSTANTGAFVVSDPEDLMDRAVALVQGIDEQLEGFDNHQWQRKLARDGDQVTIALIVDQVNAMYSDAQLALDAYLGSYPRLGKEGLKEWMLEVYNEVMDSIAGLSEEEIMGPPWHGEWNTYQVMEHIWAWNQQLLAVARRWHQPDLRVVFADLPERGKFNPYLNATYEGQDMIAVADGIVTVFRKTAAFIDKADPELLESENNYPDKGQGSLCNLMFDCYRHAWNHAVEIRRFRETDRLSG